MVPFQNLTKKSKLDQNIVLWVHSSLAPWLVIILLFLIYVIFPPYFLHEQRIVCFPLQRWEWLTARSKLPLITGLILKMLGLALHGKCVLPDSQEDPLHLKLWLHCLVENKIKFVWLQTHVLSHPLSGYKLKLKSTKMIN